jgi:hypothetical protein
MPDAERMAVPGNDRVLGSGPVRGTALRVNINERTEALPVMAEVASRDNVTVQGDVRVNGPLLDAAAEPRPNDDGLIGAVGRTDEAAIPHLVLTARVVKNASDRVKPGDGEAVGMGLIVGQGSSRQLTVFSAYESVESPPTFP